MSQNNRDEKANGDSQSDGRFFVEEKEEGLLLRFSGTWTIYSHHPCLKEIAEEIEGVLGPKGGSTGRARAMSPKAMILASDVTDWDSSLAVIIARLRHLLERHGLEIAIERLPAGLSDFLELTRKGLSPNPAHREREEAGLLHRTGRLTIGFFQGGLGFLSFTGELAMGFLATLAGRAAFRARDFLVILQDAGANSLGIVSVVSFLVGVILGFVGTVQLQQFGAEIYVANLVGIAMARDMAAMMCGIIVAGRTGAAYAAHIGTMQVNEEIDALKTLGIRPVDYLVVPRVIALSLMVPLLVIYSNMMGLAGGALVGAGLTEITLTQFIEQTIRAVPLKHFIIGVIKAFVYGVLVAAIGCLRGLQCGRSAAAVGRVTTSAVVTSIVWIIVSCAVITVVCYVLGV